MDTQGRWFAAAFLLEAQHPDDLDPDHRLFEKRVILLRAAGDSDAERRATSYCDAVPDSYRNEYGNRVVWQCKRVISVTPLFDAELKDGVEVYFELLERDPGTA